MNRVKCVTVLTGLHVFFLDSLDYLLRQVMNRVKCVTVLTGLHVFCQCSIGKFNYICWQICCTAICQTSCHYDPPALAAASAAFFCCFCRIMSASLCCRCSFERPAFPACWSAALALPLSAFWAFS